MEVKDNLYRLKLYGSFKVFGSTVVSPRGQVVIPASARKELGIDSGSTLLVCAPPHGEGLLLLKADTIEQILSTVSEWLTDFEKLAKDYMASEAANGNEGVE